MWNGYLAQARFGTEAGNRSYKVRRLPATHSGPRPGDFPIGSLQSRAAARSMLDTMPARQRICFPPDTPPDLALEAEIEAAAGRPLPHFTAIVSASWLLRSTSPHNSDGQRISTPNAGSGPRSNTSRQWRRASRLIAGRRRRSFDCPTKTIFPAMSSELMSIFFRVLQVVFQDSPLCCEQMTSMARTTGISSSRRKLVYGWSSRLTFTDPSGLRAPTPFNAAFA